MTKTLHEQIEVMQHFANSGDIERYNVETDNWDLMGTHQFNWSDYDYRIKEQKKTIIIEKWLCKSGDNSYYTVETNDISGYEKVKLLDFYDVEI